MADPVQQAGGSEQVPAQVVDTPPISVEATVAFEVKPPTAELPVTEPPTAKPPTVEPPTVELSTVEPPKLELLSVDPPTAELLTEEPVEEVKVDSAQAVCDSIKVTPIPVTDATPELSPQTKDIKEAEAIPETQQNDQLQETKEKDHVDIAPVLETSDKDEKKNETPKESEDWQKRESELLKKIQELEKVKNARSEDGLGLELKVREEEIDLLKARVKNLETELQAALSKPGGKNHEMINNIKQQHEELLSKARGMIFDKTKMVKNQELQIEALTTQVQSLKDINVITKDLLEIRNSEVKAMEERFQAMEARFKAEKERYDLVLKRAQTSTNINDDLRKEYETQLAIFKELREKYELRVQALVAENNRLKEAAKGPGTSG